VHRQRLNELAQAAEEARGEGDLAAALAHWREALELLPVNSRQHAVVEAKIDELGRLVASGAVPAKPSGHGKTRAAQLATGAGVVGLTLWKFKAILLGLTKGATLLTMLMSLGLYWSIWGWKFALGLMVLLYVHEMGHVIVLRRYGFKAGAPLFVPALGAVVLLQQRVVNPREDAAIGLAGPMYGLGATIACALVWLVWRQPIFAAIAVGGAWLNLLNLAPIGMLDGGRGFHAMSRVQRFLATAAMAAAGWITAACMGDRLLWIVAIVCLGRALGERGEPEGSWKATITYILLTLSLAALTLLHLQVPAR
jgi:Zn-dependent protease